MPFFKKLIRTEVTFLLFLLFTFFPASAFAQPVKSGLDVLQESNFKTLKGKNVGLITNHTAVNNKNEYILDIFSKQKEFQLKAIFTPEHGLRGNLDQEYIPSETFGKDIPVYSLYGNVRKPTDAMLKGLDVLVFDIQDIGTRFYTYITTLGYIMEVAAANKIKVIVLDRPNPVTGEIVEGEVMDMSLRYFTGYYPIPTRYAMTIGEIAVFYQDYGKLKLDLEIIKMQGWHRGMWFEDTGLPWIPPSPNMRFIDAAVLYPGLGSLESTNLSVGRGTPKPFIYYGAPWLDNTGLVKYLNEKKFSGLQFRAISFKPAASVFAGQEVKGFAVEITDRNKVESTEAMVYALEWIKKKHPDKLIYERLHRSFGSNLLSEMLNGKFTPEYVIETIKARQQEFLPVRAKYLLYK